MLFLWGAAGAWAQATGAQIEERAIARVLIVDQLHLQASDQNPGVPELPFETINGAVRAALMYNRNNIGVKILISPGVYRESITFQQETSAPVVFEATDKGKVIISGSDIWSEWRRQGSADTYTYEWPYAWGVTKRNPRIPADRQFDAIARRREMIFVNGRALKQVLSARELGENTFAIDEMRRAVYLRLAPTITPDAATVEVAVRAPLLSAKKATNVILRGITFQHANTPYHTHAVSFEESSHILIEDCQFLWNNWGGLHFERSQNVTVRRSVANLNGAVGMNAGFGKNFLFEDNETSYNNWRGASGGFTGWEVAGLKHFAVHDALYTGHKAVGNSATGFWLDTDNVNITVTRALLHANLGAGIYIEANQGPIVLRDDVICHNGQWGALLVNSRNLTIEKNILYGNGSAQIAENGGNDVRAVRNWETGERLQLISGDWRIWDNILVATTMVQDIFAGRGAAEASAAGASLRQSIDSGENVVSSPEERTVANLPWRQKSTLEGWRAITGRDSSTLYADPQFVDPENHQFSFLPNSPVLKLATWARSTSLSPVP